MNTPKIDLASLPGLDTVTGIFGSTAQAGAAYDDGVVAIMVYVYDVVPPSAIV
ncbi:hypothetical protein [Altererythrobacter xiamenensis]|nr:hypothetical protein [Altererythrobacter xiamenensis]